MLSKNNLLSPILKANISKTIDKLFKPDKVHNKNHVILHNVYILYFIFVIALADFLYLIYTADFYSATIFVLVGFLTYFFSKNMIFIIFLALAITNIIKCGRCSEEGFENNENNETTENDEGEEEEIQDENIETMKDSDISGNTVDNAVDSTTSKKSTKKSNKTTPTASADDISFSVENATNEKKEQFGQDTNVVYTSEEDREIQKTEKMMASQEKILKSMNKYKPLLDTLSGLTRNIAAVKGTATVLEDV
jgi:hypothetical protein